MGNATALKLNLPKRSDRYTRRPVFVSALKFVRTDKKGNPIVTEDGEIVMRDPVNSDFKIISVIYAYSHIQDYPEAVCERSYDELEKETGLSRSTIAKGLKAHKSEGIITQTKHFHRKADYKYEKREGESDFYITYEECLKEIEFEIPRLACTRRLTPYEYEILSVLGAYCNRPGAKGCDFTIEELVHLCGYCEKYIRIGLRNLISAKLVASRRIKWLHKDKRRKYSVNKHIRLLMIHNKPRCSTKEQAKANSEESVRREPETSWKAYAARQAEAADMRGERERHYAGLHEKALDRAEKNRKKAEENEDFKQADSEQKECEIALARAEVYGTEEEVKTLSQTLAEIKERRRNALKAISMKESDLLPDYTCKKCSDTGFMKDGRMCDCYPSRGSP